MDNIVLSSYEMICWNITVIKRDGWGNIKLAVITSHHQTPGK